jgi:hypothetical protein
LADFGLSKHLSSQSVGFTSRGQGTNGYLAPEFLLCLEDKIPFNRQLDIWSLGCILYELVVGRQLFVDNYYAMRCKDTGVLPDITFEGLFGENDTEPIRNAFTRMLSLDPEARPAARDLLEEFSSNYAHTTVTRPQNIEIYEEFSATYPMMSRTEIAIMSEIEALKVGTHDVQTHVQTQEMVLGNSEPQGQLPLNWDETVLAAWGGTQEVRMSEQEQGHEETETLELTGVEARMSKQEEQLPLTFDEKKVLVFTEIEKIPSNFWSWHALSCLFASNDDVAGAINSCLGWWERSQKGGALSGGPTPSFYMEVMNLLPFQGKYDGAIGYSEHLTRQVNPDEILKALSPPPSPQIRSMIPNQRSKETSLERYIPTKSITNDSASNPS